MKTKNKIGEFIGGLLFIIIMIYTTIYCPIWMWRNPKANSMTCIREFVNVIQFNKLNEYQK